MPAAHPPLPEPVDPPGSFLFADDIIQELTDQERKHGIYTAERVPVQKRDAIIRLLGEKKYPDEIARLLQVHVCTITAVADRFATEVNDIRGQLARKFRRIAWGQAERLERNPNLLPPSSIPIALKMFVETGELLDGKATSRIEHVEKIDIFADWPSVLAQLEIEGKNGASGIGLPGKKSGLMELASGPAIDVPAEVLDPAQTDSDSSLLGPIPQENRDSDTGFDTGSAPDPASRTESSNEEAGGGSTAAAGSSAATDNEPQNFWPNGFSREDDDEVWE